MQRTMSLFWFTGGRLARWRWQAKDAQLDTRMAFYEDMPLDAWASVSAEEHVALCEELGGFTPRTIILQRDIPRPARARTHNKPATPEDDQRQGSRVAMPPIAHQQK